MISSDRNNCAWCGAYLGDGERLQGRIRCAACGVATTWPWPSEADLQDAYGDWYRPPGGRFAGVGDIALRRMRARLASRIDRIAPPGPILDVGAGDGALLDALQCRGRSAVGLERNSPRSGVRTGDLADEKDDASYAVVVFWHSLEHLPNPGFALERAASLLRPGGLLVIAIPNSTSLQSRVFGDRWFALDLPRHLVHVPATALMTRLRGVGLQIERISHLRGGQAVFGWLYGLVDLIPGESNLYDAIRRPKARSRPLLQGRRMVLLAVGVLALPVAFLAALIEVALRRGGTVYVEARRP
jgi:SAM-dependent methyltransferase